MAPTKRLGPDNNSRMKNTVFFFFFFSAADKHKYHREAREGFDVLVVVLNELQHRTEAGLLQTWKTTQRPLGAETKSTGISNK